MHKNYLIFDSRYLIDEDNATVLECCDSLKEAKINVNNYSTGSVIVEYDVINGEFVNPKIIK